MWRGGLSVQSLPDFTDTFQAFLRAPPTAVPPHIPPSPVKPHISSLFFCVTQTFLQPPFVLLLQPSLCIQQRSERKQRGGLKGFKNLHVQQKSFPILYFFTIYPQCTKAENLLHDCFRSQPSTTLIPQQLIGRNLSKEWWASHNSAKKRQEDGSGTETGWAWQQFNRFCGG